MLIDDNGTSKRLAIRRGTVVGPASYATGGFPVDESSRFSSIVAVVACRRFATASGIEGITVFLRINGGSGTDTFANAKFRIMVVRMGPHTHTYDKPDTPTGNQSAEGPLGAVNHTHPLTYTSTVSGSSSTNAFSEANVGTDDSAFTYEYLVFGVPK